MATSFQQQVSLTADKRSLRWNTDGSYTIAIRIADATGERAVREINISADGQMVFDPQGKETGVALPAEWFARLSSFATSMDDLVAAIAQAGKIGI
jgi:hypothetical protein